MKELTYALCTPSNSTTRLAQLVCISTVSYMVPLSTGWPTSMMTAITNLNTGRLGHVLHLLSHQGKLQLVDGGHWSGSN